MKILPTLCLITLVATMYSVHRNDAQLISSGCLLASYGSLPLPNFVRPPSTSARFRVNPIQAIIPSYQFNCTGEITEWAIILFIRRYNNFECYSVSFEVWRGAAISSNESCYIKVGTNYVQNICPSDLDFDNPERGLINITVEESERISVKPGDVVGFTLNSMSENRRKGNGIMFSEDDRYTNELVWFTENNIDEEICNTRELLTTRIAPLITARLATAMRSLTTASSTQTTQPTVTSPQYSTASSTTRSLTDTIPIPSPSIAPSTTGSAPPNAVPVQLTAGVGAGVAGCLLLVILLTACIACCAIVNRKRKATLVLSVATGHTSTNKTAAQHSNDGSEDNTYEQIDHVYASRNQAQQNLGEENIHHVNEGVGMELKMTQNEAYGDIGTNTSIVYPMEEMYDTVSINSEDNTYSCTEVRNATVEESSFNHDPSVPTRESQAYATVSNYDPSVPTRENQAYATVRNDREREDIENTYEYLP